MIDVKATFRPQGDEAYVDHKIDIAPKREPQHLPTNYSNHATESIETHGLPTAYSYLEIYPINTSPARLSSRSIDTKCLPTRNLKHKRTASHSDHSAFARKSNRKLEKVAQGRYSCRELESHGHPTPDPTDYERDDGNSSYPDAHGVTDTDDNIDMEDSDSDTDFEVEVCPARRPLPEPPKVDYVPGLSFFDPINVQRRRAAGVQDLRYPPADIVCGEKEKKARRMKHRGGNLKARGNLDTELKRKTCPPTFPLPKPRVPRTSVADARDLWYPPEDILLDRKEVRKKIHRKGLPKPY